MIVVLLTRRNVGLIALSYLVAKKFDVKVISDDDNVIWLAEALGQKVVTIEAMGEYDYLLSVHWHKIIGNEYLKDGCCVNIHPCLQEGYKGRDPVRRFLQYGPRYASISSHYMTEIVDEGEVIETVVFDAKGAKSYADFYNEAFRHYWRILDKTINKLIG